MAKNAFHGNCKLQLCHVFKIKFPINDEMATLKKIARKYKYCKQQRREKMKTDLNVCNGDGDCEGDNL